MAPPRREPAPGVFRLVLPLPFPGLDRVNAYLLTSPEGVTLVDCGVHDPAKEDHGWGDLVAACAGTGTPVGDVTRLVITHPHADHLGLAGRVVDEVGCELWMHRDAMKELDRYRDPEASVVHLREMLIDHGVDEEVVEELLGFEDWRAFVSGVMAPDRALSDGDVMTVGGRRWRFVHTPGHSQAHVCLHSPADGLLISGDHLLGSVTPHIDFREGAGDPLGDYLASLERIEALEPSLVLPGHGRPFTDGAARARAVARHHDRRLGAILQVVRHAPQTADEITDEIFGTTLLNFHRRLALGEALAHLAYLTKRGEIERSKDEDGRYRYRKATQGRRGGDGG